MQRHSDPPRRRLLICLALSVAVHGGLLLPTAGYRWAPRLPSSPTQLTVTLPDPAKGPTLLPTRESMDTLTPETAPSKATATPDPVRSSPLPLLPVDEHTPVPAEWLTRQPELRNGEVLNEDAPPFPYSDEPVLLELVIDEQGWVREARRLKPWRGKSNAFADWLISRLQEHARFTAGELEGKRVVCRIQMEFRQKLPAINK